MEEEIYYCSVCENEIDCDLEFCSDECEEEHYFNEEQIRADLMLDIMKGN